MSKLGKFAAACAAVLVGVAAFGATCTYTDGNWDTTPSGESDDIVIVSGDLTWGAALPHKVASWTHKANGNAETYRLNVKVGGDMTLAEEAVVDSYNKGFAATKGIGAPSQASDGKTRRRR